MENNKDLEVMQKVVALLKAGKADELEAALHLVAKTAPAGVPKPAVKVVVHVVGPNSVLADDNEDEGECECTKCCGCCDCSDVACDDDNEAPEAYEEEDEYDDEWPEDDEDEEPEVNVYDLIHAAGVRKINDALIAMPTVYGRVLLMHPSIDVETAMDEIMSALDETEADVPDLMLVPVTINGGNIVFDPQTVTGDDWIMFIKEDDNGLVEKLFSGRTVFPILMDEITNDHSLGGAVCVNATDAVVAAASMLNAGMIDFEVPHVAYKVTKPGMKCKGEQYTMDEIYVFDGEIELHKKGYHFADNKAALYNWYRPFDSQNEVYRVQVQDPVIENGIGVTDSIIFTEKLDWDNIR